MNEIESKTAFRFVAETKEKKFCDCGHAETVSRENQHLQEERNVAKNDYLAAQTTKLYLEYLSKDQSLWPCANNMAENEKSARKTKHETKEMFENETEKIYTILQSANKDHSLLKDKIIQLEEKLKLFQTKKAQFESRHNLNSDSVETAVSKCEQVIKKLEHEVARLQGNLARMDTSIADMTSQITARNHSNHPLKRLRDILSFLEAQNGFKVTVKSDSTIQLEFVNNSPLLNSTTSDDFNLQMTLTLKENNEGHVQLTDVQINVDHFNIKDIIDAEGAQTNIPYLVMAVQQKWNQHFPLLSEIELLNKTHAVDWIQEECKLRVLVGKCGKTMFTLNIPRDYPTTKGIILHDTYGMANIDNTDIPGEEASLQEWVFYLENKYGDIDD